MAPKTGYGTTITIGGVNIGNVTRVSGVTKTREQVEITNLASTNEYTEFANGIKDGGSVTIEGNYDSSEAGQLACDAAIEAGTTSAFVITFPSALATTFTFNGNVQSFSIGEATPRGIIPFSAEVKVTGKPTLGTTASNNITALTITTGTAFPTFAAATYNYVVSTSGTSVTFAATFAAGTCLLYENDVMTQTLTTTVASAAVTASSTPKKVELKVTETGKTTKTYTLWLTKTA